MTAAPAAGGPGGSPVEPIGPSIAVLPGGGTGMSGVLAGVGAEVVTAELRARIDGAAIETVTTGEDLSPAGAEGRPVRTLWPWDGERADRLAAGVTSLVVVAVGGPSARCRAVVDDLAARDVQVEWVPAGEDGTDPLILSDRLATGSELDARRQLLRLSPLLPEAGPYVACHIEGAPPGTDVAVDSFAYSAGAQLCRVPADVAWPDLSAIVGGAECVVTDSRALAMVAAAFSRPVILVGGATARAHEPGPTCTGALPADGPEDILDLDGHIPPAPPAAARDRCVAAAEARLDELAARLRSERARVAARTPDDRIAELMERIALLEAVNAGLRRRLTSEREALLAVITSRGLNLPAGTAAAESPRADVAGRAEEEIRQLREELDRVYATRTMKLVAPARRAYGRVRSRLR